MSSELCVPQFPSGEEEEEELWLLRKELWGFQHWVESFSRAEGLPGMGPQTHLPALIPKGNLWNTHSCVEQFPVSTAGLKSRFWI